MTALLVIAAIGWGATAKAANTPRKPPASAQLKEKKNDLGELRQRIEQVKKDMAAAESARSEVSDQLREQERGISELQRELHELAAQRDRLQRRIAELSRETRRAETQLDGHQTQLERILVQHYMSGAPGPLRLLLSGESPNQTTRDLTYLAAIGQARQDLARQTAGLIDEKKRLGLLAREESVALEAVEARQKAQQEKMLAQREDRKKTLVRLAGKLEIQRREIDTLRRDEQRLTRLVDRLAKMIASRPKPSKPKPKAAPKDRKDRNKPNVQTTGAKGTDAPEAPDAGDDSPDFADLARLKGRLPYPVAGTVSQRFGASLEGGVRSKGIFVRTANGASVQAVAAGQVVFADWMRGFGNLLVIDHGGGFMSIYGYNEAVLKDVGASVRAGEAIAAAGSTGGRSETGLYFELRRKGEPLDPGQWLRR